MTFPRPVRIGAAVAGIGVTSALALAGCASTAAEAESDTTTQAPAVEQSTAATTDTTDTDAAASDSTYADGTYTAEGSYSTPESIETISVTVTLEDDVITAVEVTGDPTKRESEEYQAKFIGGIADVVVGKDIDEISVSRVAGSSLTSGGFNQAIEQIKADAAA